MEIYEPIYVKKLLDESWLVSTLVDSPPLSKPRLTDCNQLAIVIKEATDCDIEGKSIQNLYKMYPTDDSTNGEINSEDKKPDLGKNRTKEVLAAYVLMNRGIIDMVSTKRNPRTKKYKPIGEYYLKFARLIQGNNNLILPLLPPKTRPLEVDILQEMENCTLKLKDQFKKLLKTRISAFSTLTKLIEEFDVDSFDQVERIVTHPENGGKGKKDFEQIKEVFNFFCHLSTYYKNGMLDEEKVREEDLFELDDWFHNIIDHLFPVGSDSKWIRLETKLVNIKPLVPAKPIFISSSERLPVSEYHTSLFQAIDDLNQLLWNLDINYPSLLVENSYLSTTYTFRSLNYHLATFLAWHHKVENELVMMPFSRQDENVRYFKRYLRALKSWVCMGKEFMMSQTEHFRLIGENMDSLLRNMINGTAEAMFEEGKIISFNRFQEKFFNENTQEAEFEKINYLCEFANGISPLEDRHRWALLHGLHLLLIIFVNSYGKDFSKTSILEIHDLIDKNAQNENLYLNLEKGISQFKLDEDVYIRRLLVTLKDLRPLNLVTKKPASRRVQW